MSQTRRLAAILAADVAGYSRLMGADEEGTLQRASPIETTPTAGGRIRTASPPRLRSPRKLCASIAAPS
jgi:hypothetical protein